MSKSKISAAIAVRILGDLSGWEGQDDFVSPCMEIFGKWDPLKQKHDNNASQLMHQIFSFSNDQWAGSIIFGRLEYGEVQRRSNFSFPGAEIIYRDAQGNPVAPILRINNSLDSSPWINNVMGGDPYKNYGYDKSMQNAFNGAAILMHELAHIYWIAQNNNPNIQFDLWGPGFGPDGAPFGRSEDRHVEIVDKCLTPWLFERAPKR